MLNGDWFSSEIADGDRNEDDMSECYSEGSKEMKRTRRMKNMKSKSDNEDEKTS